MKFAHIRISECFTAQLFHSAKQNFTCPEGRISLKNRLQSKRFLLVGEEGFDYICSRREQIKVLMRSDPHQATVHRTVAFTWVRIRLPFSSKQKTSPSGLVFYLVGEDGFEPSKRNAADLQSVPFGHSGTPPYSVVCIGAGRRTRTPDLLITNQLLYRLSYTGSSNRT